MSILYNRLLLLLPLIILVAISILSLILIPSVNPTPSNLPIAIVNEDQGVNIHNQVQLNMGLIIVENITTSSTLDSGENSVIKWVEVENYETVKEALNNQKYYAALIIPKEYSAKQASLITSNPITPEIEILINQGMNIMAATMAGQVLNEIVDNINNTLRSQLLDEFDKQGGILTTAQASLLVSPISIKVTTVNKIGTHSANGNAPVILFQPLWIACIIGAITLFQARKIYFFTNRKERFLTLIVEIFVAAITSVVTGYSLTYIAINFLKLDIPMFSDTALFLSITYFCFSLMILATISWIGLKGGLAVYVIIMFFGAPLLAIPPEFMSQFYRENIYQWLPMRFMVEGLRELFYFGKELSFNQPTIVLTGITIMSIIVLLSSVIKPDPNNKIKYSK